MNQNRMNPVDSQGKLMKCLVCELIMHFKRDCQHAIKNRRDSVLQMTDIEEDVNKVYDHVVECSGRTVLSCLEPVCLFW